MRRFALAALLALVTPAAAQDVDPSGAAFVEIVPERDAWYAGEWVRAEVRLGYDAEFFERNVVQSYQRELDVPLRVVAPWASADVQWFRNPRDEESEIAWNERTLALYGGETEERDGRSYVVLRRRVAVAVHAVGELELTTHVELTYAAEFREDFVEGRVAIDPQRIRGTSHSCSVRVFGLPTEGRPAEFSGAVGQVTVVARLEEPSDGESDLVRIELRVWGAHLGPAVELPALADLPGFRVVGSRDGYPFAGSGNTGAGSTGQWTASRHYELERTDGAVRAIPPIPFTYFDPVEGAFRTVHTERIALPDELAAPVPAAPSQPTDVDGSAPTGVIPIVVAVVLALVVGLLLLARRGRATEPSQASFASADALRALDTGDADPADVLSEILARHLGCDPAAVVSRDLERRLRASGVSVDVAGETSALLEHLVAARYGGAAATPDDRARLRTLVQRLDDGS